MQKETYGTGFVKINPKEKIERSGFPVGYDSKTGNLCVDTNSYHHLVIGSTGSGKTQTTVLPMLRMMGNASESFLVIDHLGELWKKTENSLKEENYQTILLNFEDYRDNHWNPLSILKDSYQKKNSRLAEELENLASQIFVTNNTSSDPFWERSVADYFIGLCYWLLEEGKEITFQSVWNLSQEGNKVDSSLFRKEYKGEMKDSERYLSLILNAPVETKASILSVFNQKMKKFLFSQSLVDMMSTTDFDWEKIASEKTAIFIILPEYLKNQELISLFIRQVYDNMVGNRRFHFLLDDFALLAPIPDMNLLLENARRKDIHFTVLVPSLEIFIRKYGKEIGKDIKESFSTILYLLSNDIETLEEIASFCKGMEKEITIQDLRTLKYYEGILIKMREVPRRVVLQPDYKIDWGYKS